MGLDGVEIVMAIEEEFKITISDSEAAGADTVGKVVDLVHARLRHNTEEPCPSQHGFYVVRKELTHQLGIARSAVMPDTLLEDLIPLPNRRSVWKALIRSITGEDNVAVSLVRPRRLNRIVALVVPAVAFFATLIWVPLTLFWLGIFPALLVLFLGDRVTTRFKTNFPPSVTRVRDLVQMVRTLDCRVWTRDEVFEKVRDIAASTLGIKPEQVKLESRWADDLGVG